VNLTPARRLAVPALLAGAILSVASAASADALAGSSTISSGTEQRTIVEPVCRSEYAPVAYDDEWSIHTVTLPAGALHIDLAQHGTVSWTQDQIAYAGRFTQSQSQDYAAQDVLRDDLTVEASGSDGSQVHASVRIIGQIRNGQVQLDQWTVTINC
jgi:hypothetical protein